MLPTRRAPAREPWKERCAIVSSADPGFAVLLAACGVAALVVGFLRTSVGGGIGLLLAPTLSLVLPPSAVLALIAPLMTLCDPIALRLYWRRWDPAQLRILLPTTLAGVAGGVWALSRLSELWLARSIGVLALTFGLLQLALVLAGQRRPILRGRPAGAAAGLLTGVASSVAHSGGVVLGLYLVGAGLAPASVVATGAVLVTITNVMKLASYWGLGFLTRDIGAAALLSAPLLLVGAWLGYRVHHRLPRRLFETTLVAIAVAGALRLLLRA